MKYLRIALVIMLVLFALSCKKKPTELIQIDDPIFNPGSGTHLSGQAITITCPEFGATIRYTVDGTEPNEQSTVYSSPLIIPNFFPQGSNSATLKARAYKTGFDPSEVVQASYTVSYFNTVSTPHFSPGSGDITSVTDIYILCSTLNASTYYTLDGSEPTQSSILYSEAFNITTAGTYTIKAKAFRDLWNPSDLSTVTYNVTVR